MRDHAEVDHIDDGHDDNGCQRRVRDVVEHGSEELQSQQHQRTWQRTETARWTLRLVAYTTNE